MSQFLKLHHGSLIVADITVALEFYKGVLGVELDESRPDLGYPGAWLEMGEGQIHLLELPNPDPIENRPQHVGRDRHLAFLVADLDEIVIRLEQAAVPHSWSRSGRRAIFFRDPDGNGLELLESA